MAQKTHKLTSTDAGWTDCGQVTAGEPLFVMLVDADGPVYGRIEESTEAPTTETDGFPIKVSQIVGAELDLHNSAKPLHLYVRGNATWWKVECGL